MGVVKKYSTSGSCSARKHKTEHNRPGSTRHLTIYRKAHPITVSLKIFFRLIGLEHIAIFVQALYLNKCLCIVSDMLFTRFTYDVTTCVVTALPTTGYCLTKTAPALPFSGYKCG